MLWCVQYGAAPAMGKKGEAVLADQGQNWAADLRAKPEISGARCSYKKEPKPAADQ